MFVEPGVGQRGRFVCDALLLPKGDLADAIAWLFPCCYLTIVKLLLRGLEITVEAFNGKEIGFFPQENTDFQRTWNTWNMKKHSLLTATHGWNRCDHFTQTVHLWVLAFISHWPKSKLPICLSLSAPLIHLLEPFYHRNTHRKRALLPCALRPAHKVKDRQTMQIKLRHRADHAPCK